MVPITVISLNLHVQRPSLFTLTSETRCDDRGESVALYSQQLQCPCTRYFKSLSILYAYTNQYRKYWEAEKELLHGQSRFVTYIMNNKYIGWEIQ